MFRCITVALVCAAAWSLAQAASADPSARAPVRKVTLEEAVARAIDAAPGLRAREELIAGAEAQVRQGGAWPNPTLEGELENFAGSGRFSDLDESELTLSLTQRFEREGKREGRVAVAQGEREGAVLEHERTRLNVAFDARKAYIEAFAAAVALDNADARLAGAKQIEAMAARRVAAARDPVMVRLRAEIQTAEAHAARELVLHELHHAKRTLAVLWADPEATFEVDKSALNTPPAAMGHGIEAPTSPDVAAREIAARKAASKLALEQANARSDVSVGAGIRRFENGGDVAAVVSLSVPLAIFDSNQGNIDRAAAERRAAEFEVADARKRLDISLLALEEEAFRAGAELDTVRSQLLPRAKNALAAARRGYDAGAFSYQEVAEAQRILAELSTREINALKTLHIAHASLDRLLGRTVAAANQGKKQ